ncbi:MAG TPA: GNAT family N-acetyltransferase [Candidatus Bathyarchaeia archaeon]|nr:GNAT family N-acetyltransferase [Candidatus Bathyarchaeia archaeon]
MQTVRLKNGKEVILRSLTAEDEEGLVQMFDSMSDEALRWGLPPYTREVVERWINNLSNLIALVAEYENRLVGYATIYKYSHPRRKGVSDLGIYLHQDFHNVGLGTAMLNYLLELAKEQKLHRIGLHVIADNKIAIRLYTKFGFKTEGIIKYSYFGADRKYHDEIVMGMTLR